MGTLQQTERRTSHPTLRQIDDINLNRIVQGKHN